MKNQRKQMRVTIPAEMAGKFDEAKRSAEDQAMMALSDTQFATRLIVWALRKDPPQ